MAVLASLASRPDLDTLVAHISPDDANYLLRQGGAGTKSRASGLMQFYSDSESEDNDREARSDLDGVSNVEASRGGMRGANDRGFESGEIQGVSNADATRAAQSSGIGGYRDAVNRGYGLTADAMADARGWGLSMGDTISKAGGGYGYASDPQGFAGMRSNAQAEFANSVFGDTPLAQNDLAATSPGLMGAISQAQQFGAPQAVAAPQERMATIPKTGAPRANYPHATNNPFGIMQGGKLRSFATLEDARKYQRDLLSSPRYAGKTLEQLTKTYVGAVDPKKQEVYVKNMEEWTGFPRSTVVDPKNASLMDAIQAGIMRQESGGKWSDFYGGE